MKALGPSDRLPAWRSIEVRQDESGRCTLRLTTKPPSSPDGLAWTTSTHDFDPDAWPPTVKSRLWP